jgi:hypothetical protein
MEPAKSVNFLITRIIFLSFIFTAEAALPENSQAASPAPATVVMLQNEPTTTGLWAIWSYQIALLGNKAFISHYEGNGSPLQVLGVPRSSANLPQSGFVFLPGADPRFYCATYLPLDHSHNALVSVEYQNLLTDQTTRLATYLDLSICRQDSWPLTRYLQHTVVYNPDLNRVYIPCFADTATKQAALVIDPVSDKIVGSLPYVPLAYNPVSHRLYSLKYYPDPTSIFYGEDFDVVPLDARTEQPSSVTPGSVVVVGQGLAAPRVGVAGVAQAGVDNRFNLIVGKVAPLKEPVPA